MLFDRGRMLSDPRLGSRMPPPLDVDPLMRQPQSRPAGEVARRSRGLPSGRQTTWTPPSMRKTKPGLPSSREMLRAGMLFRRVPLPAVVMLACARLEAVSTTVIGDEGETGDASSGWDREAHSGVASAGGDCALCTPNIAATKGRPSRVMDHLALSVIAYHLGHIASYKCHPHALGGDQLINAHLYGILIII